MCRRVTCSKCGKPTWAGCGAHIEQVLGNVPPASRCRCREQPPSRAAGRDAEAKASSPEGSGAIDKILRFFKGRS